MPAWKTKALRGPWKRVAFSAKRGREPVVERQHLAALGLRPPDGLSAPPAARAAARPGRRSRRSPRRGGRAPRRPRRTACPAGGRPPPSSRPARGRGGRTSRSTAAAPRGAVGVGEASGEGSRPRAALRTPAMTVWRLDPDQLEQGRHEVAGVAEAWRSLAVGRDPLGQHRRPADRGCRRRGCSACSAQRRVRRHRPAMREVGVDARSADVVDAGRSFSAIGSGLPL